MEREAFIKEVASKCKNSNAALFLGAGMSTESGLPSWKQLFEPMARELNIDIEKTDYQLYDIAQFYENDKGVSELHKKVSYEINFDRVIETNYYRKGKITNVIYSEDNLIRVDLNKNINIFKLNGDISDLKRAIVTKKNLEEYESKHKLLLSFFKRELVVKSFLFLGYSFTDSIVLSCISELSQAFDGNHPYHYTILKKCEEPDFLSFVSDLEKRYHIKTLLINDYDEIKGILREINYYTNQKNIFISGSYRSNDEQKLLEVSKFCDALANRIYREDFRIINGYGYKVGYYIASAATKIMLEENVASFEKYLLMYPFDEHLTPQQKYRHREFMISKANAIIFIFGSDSEESGMLEEFEISKNDNRKLIIPIGSTGGAAKKICEEVKRNITLYPYLEKVIDALLNEKRTAQILSIIIDVIKQNLN